MKWIKRTVAALLVLLFLLLLAALALVITFDPNDYKPRIAALVEQHTGQAVRFDGEIKLSLFPYIGAEISGLALIQPEPFSTLTERDAWLRVDQVEAHAALLPLLRGEFEIGTLKAAGLDAHILHLADGRSNLDGLLEQMGGAQPDQPAPPSAAQTDKTRAFSIGGVEIQQARVHWEDRQRQRQIRLTGLDMIIGAITPNQPIDWQFSTPNLDYEDASLGSLTAKLAGQGVVVSDREQERLSLTDLTVDFAPRSLSPNSPYTNWPVLLGDYRLDADIYLTMADDQLRAENIHLSGEGLRSEAVEQMRLSVRTALGVNLTNRSAVIEPFELELGGRGLNLAALGMDAAGADAFFAQWSMAQPALLDQSGALDMPAMSWQLVLRDLDLPEITAESPAQLEINADWAGVRLSAERELTATSLATSLVAEQWLGMPQINAQLKTAFQADLAELDFKTTGLNVDADLTMADPQWLPIKAHYTGDLHARPSAGTLNLPEVSLSLNQAQLDGVVALDGLDAGTAWSANGNLAIADLDLAHMLTQWGHDVTALSSDALHDVAFASDFRAAPSTLAFDAFELRVDGQTVTGDLTLLQEAQSTAVRASLESPALAIDPYLPQQPAVGDDADAEARDEPDHAPLLSPEMQALLREWDMQIDARVGLLTYQKWDLSDLAFRFQATEGVLDVPQLTLSAFTGDLNATVSLDVRGAKPAMATTLDATGVEIEPLLTLLGVAPRLSGRGDLQADLTTSGNDHDTLVANLHGTAATRLEDGVVQGVDIGYWLRRANTQISGGDVGTVDRAETDFSALTVSAVIESGVVHSDDLDMRAPLFRVTGAGQFDLPAEQIDYRAAASVVSSLKGQGGRNLQELRGITVPVLITGRFDNPQVRLDIEQILRDAAQGQVRERIDRELDRHLEEDAPVRELLDRFLR